MSQLKNDIKNMKLQNVPSRITIHQKTTYIANVVTGANALFTFISTILKVYQDIPLAGPIIQMMVMISNSLTIVTAPKKTFSEKVYATAFLATIIALLIAAAVVGSFFAAIIGTVVTLTLAIVEGIGLFRKMLKKFEASKALNNKTEFNELIDSLKAPKDDSFDEQLEIRAIELEHRITKEQISTADKQKYSKELEFISTLLKDKNIVIGSKQNAPPFILRELYKKRDEELTKLAAKVSLISQKPTLDDHLKAIQLLQEEIVLIDKEIDAITEPIGKLALKEMIAEEQLALAVSTVTIGTFGAVLSIIGLLLFIGSIAAPPFIVPLMFGIGIGLAAISLIKWGAEKITQREDAQYEELETAVHKESILDEALYAHEHPFNTKVTPVGNSSHTKYMRDLRSQPTSAMLMQVEEEIPPPSEARSVGSSPPTLFKTDPTIALEKAGEQEKTNDEKLTPTL